MFINCPQYYRQISTVLRTIVLSIVYTTPQYWGYFIYAVKMFYLSYSSCLCYSLSSHATTTISDNPKSVISVMMIIDLG